MRDDVLRATTLWQPWASAMAHQLKRIETRGYPTKCRGPLLIHAAARKPDRYDWDILTWAPIAKALAEKNINDPKHFPLGAAVCIVNLVDCVPVEDIRHKLSPVERALGNYEDGRFAWVTEFLHYIEKPIPMKGKQGFWFCDKGHFCDAEGNPIAELEARPYLCKTCGMFGGSGEMAGNPQVKPLSLAEIKLWMAETEGKGGIGRRDLMAWLIAEVERLTSALKNLDAEFEYVYCTEGSSACNERLLAFGRLLSEAVRP